MFLVTHIRIHILCTHITDTVAATRFKWDEEMRRFPNAPARVLYFAIAYLKKACLPVVRNEVWRENGHGGYPMYAGDVEVWRSPSDAWNYGGLECRRTLVKLGHCDLIRLRQFGEAFGDVLNMTILGIIGDNVPDYNITLAEAIERNGNNNNNNNFNGLNDDLM